MAANRQSWNDVMASEVKPVEFWLEPYIPKGGITILFGKYGTYKTPLTITMGAAIARGLDTWGLTASKGKVLYVEADTPPVVLKPRIQTTRMAMEGFDFFWAYPGFNVLAPSATTKDSEIYNELVKLHEKEQYNVVFLDSLRCLHALPDKDSENPPRIYQAVAKMFPGASLVFIHHAKKTVVNPNPNSNDLEKDEVDHESFSGSQAWINHATVGLMVKHVNKDNHLVKITHTKSQASELINDILLTVDDGILVSTPHELNNQAYKGALKFIKQGLSLRDQDKAVAKYLGISERTAREYRLSYEEASGDQQHNGT